VGLGIGVFSFDPYAYLGGEKYLLRTLGTEGQGSSLYPELQPYNPIAISIPIHLGAKYAINARTNVFAELTYRMTSTDYLDDVSGLYAPDAFLHYRTDRLHLLFYCRTEAMKPALPSEQKANKGVTACRKMHLPLSK
jgi:hypothetical protein